MIAWSRRRAELAAEFVARRVAETGLPPTTDEVGAALHGTRRTATKWLDAAVALGLLERRSFHRGYWPVAGDRAEAV